MTNTHIPNQYLSENRDYVPRRAGTAAALRRGAGRIRRWLAGCAGVLLVASTGIQAGAADLFEQIASDPGLAVFANAVEQAGLSDRLKEAGPFVVFAPSDEAMRREGSSFLLELVLVTPSNADRLVDVVAYHVIQGVDLTQEGTEDNPVTLAGIPLHVRRTSTAFMVDGWAVVTRSVTADNGTLHVIDRLLYPSWQSGEPTKRVVAEHRGGPLL